MDFTFYCRRRDKKLYEFLISDVDDLQSARQTVIEHLYDCEEIFFCPISFLIKSIHTPTVYVPPAEDAA